MSNEEEEQKVTIELEEFPAFRDKMMEIADRDNLRSKLQLQDLELHIKQRQEMVNHNLLVRRLYATTIIINTLGLGLLVYIGFII